MHMKVFLLLNGPIGIQTGIEDGFNYLLEEKIIKELDWFYYTDYFRLNGKNNTDKEIIAKINTFQPDLVILFHIGGYPLNKELIIRIKGIHSKPFLVYDEGDMYGGINKPVKNNLKIAFKYSDIVSIRGLGKWHNYVSKFNKNIIYTPHHADIHRYLKKPFIWPNRENDIIFVGNTFNEKYYFRYLRALPGAVGRKRFVNYIDKNLNYNLKIYGNFWANLKSDKGSLPFENQIREYQNSWITIAYEHYPTVPYYFSNRLPMALLAGSLYVCHYHGGYENIFPPNDFIFFFKENYEAISIIEYLFSLGDEELIRRSRRAREFAIKNFTPQVVWKNFLFSVFKKLKISN